MKRRRFFGLLGSALCILVSKSGRTADTSRHGTKGPLRAGASPVAPLPANLRDYVSVTKFGAVGDGVADDAAAIQLALNTGKSIRVPSGKYYLGIKNTGNFLTITAKGQCIYFDDGALFVAYGTATVTNTASVILNDSFSGCYLYNPTLVSNGNALTSSVRDSPYGYTVTCTTATVNSAGIFNGKGTLLQGMFLASKSTFSNTFEVNRVHLDYFSDRCYYGVSFSNTGNLVTGQVNCLDAQRAYIGYGCNTQNIVINSRYDTATIPKAQSILGAGVTQNGTTKDTYAIKLKYTHSGYPTYSGIRFVFAATYFSKQPTPKIYDIELDYSDVGASAGSSIGFQYTLDGAPQTSYTGNLWNRITIKGNAFAKFDMTSQGAIGVPVSQSEKGFADFSNLNIPALSGIYDPMNGYLFNGKRAGQDKSGHVPQS